MTALEELVWVKTGKTVQQHMAEGRKAGKSYRTIANELQYEAGIPVSKSIVAVWCHRHLTESK